MPWPANSDLPPSVRGALPPEAQTRFRTVANGLMASGGSEQSAIRQAWHVVGQGWRAPIGGAGKWVRKAAQSLYLSRPLENGDEFIEWARSQGFETTLPAHDLHVTIAFSKEPVAWPEPLEGKVTARFPEERSVAPLGDGGAVVLKFKSPRLSARWAELVDAGASWDHPSYQPHVTISWQAGDVDLSEVVAFRRPLVFGPERMRAIDSEWRSSVAEEQGVTFDKAEVYKIDEDLGLVFGWGLVSKVNGEDFYDSQGDHIPEDAMLKAAANFMLSGRVAKEMHTGEQKGTIVFAWPLTVDIAKAMEINTKFTGLMIAMKPTSEDILNKFRDGTYTGFSIGGSRIVDEEVD